MPESNFLLPETQIICEANGLKWRHWAGLVISLFFIYWIQTHLGWGKIIETWQILGPAQCLLALALIFTSYFIRSLRLFYYCKKVIKNKWLIAFKIHLQHNFYNNLIPMRAGELSFPLLMKTHFKLSYAESAGTLLWFRLLDLQALLLFSLTALHAQHLIRPEYALPLMILVLVCPTFVLLPSIKRLITANQPQERKQSTPALNKPLKTLAILLERLKNGLPQTQSAFWVSWALTLTNWAVKILVFAWVLEFFHPMPLSIAIMGAIGGEATSLLPIHGFAGIGSYEAGIAGALMILDQPRDAALVGAINLHLFLICSTILSMIMSLFIKGNDHNKEGSDDSTSTLCHHSDQKQ